MAGHGWCTGRRMDVTDLPAVLETDLNGYVAGFPLYSGDFGDAPGKVYEPNLHCNGSERTLNRCPHEGWKPTKKVQPCFDHSKDAAVFCYSSVKLGSGVGAHITHGPVLYYNSESRAWEAICDTGFTDTSAAVVCRELGFKSGRAIRSSAYGKIYEDMHANMTLSCDSEDMSVKECMASGPCNRTDFYASVACFKSETEPSSENYTFEIKALHKNEYTGMVEVKHYGLSGRICSIGWDDKDAQVLCRSLSYQHGIAYHHSDNDFSPLLRRGPFWVANVSCRGDEPSLDECKFNDRQYLGNCSGKSNGAVLCYNNDGLKYRIKNDDSPTEGNYGRVELSVNGVWGTICDSSWDDKDARVLCHQHGYDDGYALGSAHYGMAKEGPVWLSHLRCSGAESSLDQCEHRGFHGAVIDSSVGWWKCKSHKDDASVYCINDLKLSGGFNATSGAVLVYHNHEWHAVCDSDFDYSDARVVCRTLGFVDGKAIPGSAFGNIGAVRGVSSSKCDGNEKQFRDCKLVQSSDCVSGTYASVYCSNKNVVDTGFHIRIKPDNVKSGNDFFGFLEVHINGIWGSVCRDRSWNEKAANVACRQMGFAGGVAYKPPKNFTSPMLLSDVECMGSEQSLLSCSFKNWNLKTGCDFYSDRAGVFCYQDAGLEFRLGGGEGDRGRAEMKYNGMWGGMCDWLWDARDARVFCRHIGYVDGLEIVGARYGHVDGPLWFTRVSCEGNESSILECRHTGFNSSDRMEGVYAGLCRTRSHDAAVRCFNTKLEVTEIRLSNPENATDYGRVEVFVSGPDTWGTVCDDYWDDSDATVVCRQLGFAEGRGVKGAYFGRGRGPIWKDNLRCAGNETRLQDCKSNSLSVQNCNHGEDAGVFCKGVYVPPSTTAIPVTRRSEVLTAEIETGGNIIIAVTVSIIVILLAIIFVGGVIMYRRTRPKGEIKKALVNNDMNDPNLVPPVTSDGRVTLSKLKAHFTKSKSRDEGVTSGSKGIANPTYEDSRIKGNVVMEEVPEADIEQPTTSSFNYQAV